MLEMNFSVVENEDEAKKINDFKKTGSKPTIILFLKIKQIFLIKKIIKKN